VSVEVAPELARDTGRTVEAARELWRAIDEPNLFVKIPGTAEGLPAIQKCLGEGININVTLLFGLDRYGEVIEAYITGLEELDRSGGDVTKISSVASFFVSRVDTEVDRRLEAIGTPKALALRGKAAVANAQLAYELFLKRFDTDRWRALAGKGAAVQRPLWASTSTKNPAYPDTLYVDGLIGPETVNTMPDETIEAFQDHGKVALTLEKGLAQAHKLLDELAEVGVDYDDVTATLEEEGVQKFADSFEELLDGIREKLGQVVAA
jgi:transaldolase